MTEYAEVKKDIAAITKMNTKSLLSAVSLGGVPAGVALDGCMIGIIGALLEMSPRGDTIDNIKSLQAQFNAYVDVAIQSVADVDAGGGRVQ